MAASLTIDGNTHGISGGQFNLTANIDAAGILMGGSFSITGSVPGYDPLLGPTLLTGDVQAFGYNNIVGNTPDPFEFLFTNTGGDLAGLFGPQFGVILTLTNGLPINTGVGTPFASDFSGGTRAGVADTAPIPEPTSGLLALIGGFFVMRRVRQVNHTTQKH
jgi:hypothetical protein